MEVITCSGGDNIHGIGLLRRESKVGGLALLSTLTWLWSLGLEDICNYEERMSLLWAGS